MTSQDSNSIAITTQIRRAGSIALGTSYAYIGLPVLMPAQKNFQSWIDQAIERWYSSLSPAQKSALPDLQVNLKISATFPKET